MYDESKVITVTKLSKMLCISEQTIRTWLRNGQISGIQINRKWLIPKTEVDKILKTKK